jgi:AraC-like DNA-binding protein
MVKKYFNIILLLCFPLAIFSQELTKDEVRKIREVQELLVSNPEKAYEETQKMARSTNGLYQLFGTYYRANYHYNKSDYKTAKQILISLLNDIRANKKTASNQRYIDLKAMCLNKLFYIYKNLGEYGQALLYLDRFKEGISADRFDLHYGIAKVALGKYTEGIALLKHDAATSFHRKLGEGESQAMNDKLFADKYNTIGEAYQKYYIQSGKRALIDSSDYYFDKAAQLMLSDNFEVDYTKALLYMRKADNARLSERYKEALSLYRTGKAYKVINQNIRTVQLFDLGMSDCFFHLKNYDEAILYANSFIKNYAVTKISKENLLIAYNILSKSFDAKNDAKQAYAYAKKSLALLESIEEIKQQSLGFVHNYDLKIIKSESRALLDEKKFFKLGIIGVLVILLGLAFGFYYYYRLQKKKYQRFLQILKRVREHSTATNPGVLKEPPVKLTMEDELISKLKTGLTKLEEKEAYLKPNFKLDFVAKKLNTNTAYLSQYFNRVMLKSFSEYTQELRINHVLQKLNENPQYRNYTVQAIAEDVGYKDATSFVRVFKKQTGLSPNYYIEELKK